MIRVQKYLATCGIASRREAESMIEEGRVRVNNVTITLGDQCEPGKDTVSLDGRTIPWRPPARLVLVLNKPRGYVCSNEDPHNEKTVFTLLPPPLRRERLFCVGRLDKESEGLVLLTNDGELGQSLAHPSKGVTKRYRVRLDRSVNPEDARKLIRGIVWEGERLQIDKILPIRSTGRTQFPEMEVQMQHGKKREIRRLLHAFDYKVKRLVRTQIGQFRLKGLAKGQIRELKPAEIDALFS